MLAREWLNANVSYFHTEVKNQSASSETLTICHIPYIYTTCNREHKQYRIRASHLEESWIQKQPSAIRQMLQRKTTNLNYTLQD